MKVGSFQIKPSTILKEFMHLSKLLHIVKASTGGNIGKLKLRAIELHLHLLIILHGRIDHLEHSQMLNELRC